MLGGSIMEYKKSIKYFSGGLYIINNRDLPGVPTLPDIDPNGGGGLPDYPYWKPTTQVKSLYYGDSLEEFHLYTYTEDTNTYFLYQNKFYTEAQLDQQEGFTETPSIPIPEGWYNPELDKYWITDKGGWYDEIPPDGDYMSLYKDTRHLTFLQIIDSSYNTMDLS